MYALFLTLGVLLSVASASPIEERFVGSSPTVTIADGVVVGTSTPVKNQPGVNGKANAWLGIPYAQSPPLRFAPPTAPKKWTTPLKTQTNPPACLQQFLSGADGEREKMYFNNPTYPPPAESEDCMYLNVFAPPTASPTNLKSVMFWIFGGNNMFGTASLTFYDGSSLAVNHDVVVVVINYRTNIFGFSNSPQIPRGQQNSGMLDQRFALQWVQANIKQFGGDPTKVTIFGESAGGYNVKQLLANPPNPLPFRAAIMESQQDLPTGSGLASYNAVLTKFNCRVSLNPLACIRKVSGTAIRDFISESSLGFPDVRNDGISSGDSNLHKINTGQFAKVPILMGTNKMEGTVFAEILGVGSDLDVIGDALAPLGVNNALIEPLLAAYAASVTNATSDLVSQFITDFFFTCPTSSLSNALASAGHTVNRYRYDPNFPNLDFGKNFGAYHTSEIPSVWGTYALSNSYGRATADQIGLSRYMQGVWSNFAKNPYAGTGWPKLGSNGGVELGLLGSQGSPQGVDTVALQEADKPCEVLGPAVLAAGFAY